MREILFRGKRVGSEEWVEGFYLTSPEFDNQEVAVITTDKPRNPYYVSKETIGQYTGLTDKNGTKIFEGDIVRVILPHFPTTIGVVEYHEDFFGVDIKDVTPTQHCIGYAIKNGAVEIIGNIHDNPELLKERDNDE